MSLQINLKTVGVAYGAKKKNMGLPSKTGPQLTRETGQNNGGLIVPKRSQYVLWMLFQVTSNMFGICFFLAISLVTLTQQFYDPNIGEFPTKDLVDTVQIYHVFSPKMWIGYVIL